MIYKFVKWEIPELSKLKKEVVYKLHEKLEKGKKLNRTEANTLSIMLENQSYKVEIHLQGYAFNFREYLKKFYVEQYGQVYIRYAIDKTAVRNAVYGVINNITEVN